MSKIEEKYDKIASKVIKFAKKADNMPGGRSLVFVGGNDNGTDTSIVAGDLEVIITALTEAGIKDEKNLGKVLVTVGLLLGENSELLRDFSFDMIQKRLAEIKSGQKN
jgi:hypothetical protein